MAAELIHYSVSGSRNATENDIDIIHSTLNQYKHIMAGVHVGNATGVDFIVKKWCIENEVACDVYAAKWDRYGRAAGPIRNKELIDNSKQLIAFPGPKSKGTKNTIKLAIRHHDMDPIIQNINN